MTHKAQEGPPTNSEATEKRPEKQTDKQKRLASALRKNLLRRKAAASDDTQDS